MLDEAAETSAAWMDEARGQASFEQSGAGALLKVPQKFFSLQFIQIFIAPDLEFLMSSI